MQSLGTRIKERRKALGMSQAALAKQSGTTQATISDLESGTTKRGYSDTISAIAKTLAATPEFILKGTALPKREPTEQELAEQARRRSAAEAANLASERLFEITKALRDVLSEYETQAGLVMRANMECLSVDEARRYLAAMAVLNSSRWSGGYTSVNNITETILRQVASEMLRKELNK